MYIKLPIHTRHRHQHICRVSSPSTAAAMPAIRDHTDPHTPSAWSQRHYANGLAQLKGEFRGKVTQKLSTYLVRLVSILPAPLTRLSGTGQVSGNSRANMGWSEAVQCAFPYRFVCFCNIAIIKNPSTRRPMLPGLVAFHRH